MQNTFYTGVIEGFYGRLWAEEDRLDMLKWLPAAGMSRYIYAPKGDALLRRDWAEPLDQASVTQFKKLSAVAGSSQLQWGLGLSPLGAVENFTTALRREGQAKVRQLADLGVHTLALLFDDMKCLDDSLAERQLEIIECLTQAWSGELIVCPSYYSLDPILERVFGDRPENYFSDLSKGLANEVGVFWTGNKVCSTHVSNADVDEAAALLGDRIVLWDNYPVNDGEKASKLLHLRPFEQRERGVESRLRGHYCNPMNQCQLSRAALASLMPLYAGGRIVDDHKYRMLELFGAELGAALYADTPLFQDKGLQGLSEQEKQGLIRRYRCFAHPAAIELCEWLQGQYAFDPACLTD